MTGSISKSENGPRSDSRADEINILQTSRRRCLFLCRRASDHVAVICYQKCALRFEFRRDRRFPQEVALSYFRVNSMIVRCYRRNDRFDLNWWFTVYVMHYSTLTPNIEKTCDVGVLIYNSFPVDISNFI